MIDMTKVSEILDECVELIEKVDGVEYSDDGSNKVPRSEREARVRNGRLLQLLADRLLLAHTLVMNEYWVARGERDPLS